MCGMNSKCTNTEGSYMCTCSDGFTGNGSHCSGETILTHKFMSHMHTRTRSQGKGKVNMSTTYIAVVKLIMTFLLSYYGCFGHFRYG